MKKIAIFVLVEQFNRVDEDTCHLNVQIIEVKTGAVLGGYANDFRVETE